ncbi:TlpA disulfide reductase family protein [Aliiglaciecola sp. LCG003]|uniref:TlpA family protein disulfide reductase n=1 Tax=Aliiglaciecola sp. LCG003 TaxID=3053655 RepID=UPI002573DF97|nr:TlpA disulfide reductase family protein [Aliiglaciecola sp. LCG003]WJG08758.1 TlpA disulfide reductase family protein [Aliiglaciecola sp. LCG003]
MNSKPFSNFYYLFVAVISLLIIATFTAKASDTISSAPDFTLKSQSGENMRLEEQQGNVVLINFWASWCAPCREELPHFEAMQQEYQDIGFTVLAVNVDENPEKATALLKDIAVSFPVLFDDNDQVSKLYDVRAMPTTVIIDRDGNKRLTHYGYKTGDETKYQSVVKALLRE